MSKPDFCGSLLGVEMFGISVGFGSRSVHHLDHKLRNNDRWTLLFFTTAFLSIPSPDAEHTAGGLWVSFLFVREIANLSIFKGNQV